MRVLLSDCSRCSLNQSLETISELGLSPTHQRMIVSIMRRRALMHGLNVPAMPQVYAFDDDEDGGVEAGDAAREVVVDDESTLETPSDGSGSSSELQGVGVDSRYASPYTSAGAGGAAYDGLVAGAGCVVVVSGRFLEEMHKLRMSLPNRAVRIMGEGSVALLPGKLALRLAYGESRVRPEDIDYWALSDTTPAAFCRAIVDAGLIMDAQGLALWIEVRRSGGRFGSCFLCFRC